ncbi:MAG: flagellar motor switch protein FliN [Phycisphaerae bacterium]
MSQDSPNKPDAPGPVPEQTAPEQAAPEPTAPGQNPPEQGAADQNAIDDLLAEAASGAVVGAADAAEVATSADVVGKAEAELASAAAHTQAAADQIPLPDGQVEDLAAAFKAAEGKVSAEEAERMMAAALGMAEDRGGGSAGPSGDDLAIDEILKQASFDSPEGPGEALPDASPFDLPDFQQALAEAQVSSIDMLRDVDLNVKIELGRSRMLVEDVLKLSEGSVVELDKLAGDPVDVFVNERLVARGEVLVLNDNFCVRVNEIVAGTKSEA